MTFSILGISGSPVKKGNVEMYLDTMLNYASEMGYEPDTLHLSTLSVSDCLHCNYCMKKQTETKYCSLKDDGQKLFEKVEKADILIFASPVYFMRTSARMAAFIDRLRVFIFGNVAGGRLKNKIGVSAAVSWVRNGGIETTHLCHINAFLTLEMIPVSVHHTVSPLGASGMGSENGTGRMLPDVRHGVMEDAAGLAAGRAFIDRAVEMASLIHPKL